MSKAIPEINISTVDYNSVSNDIHSDIQSEGATDCELLDNYQQITQQDQTEMKKFQKPGDIFLTDVEGSSEDEIDYKDYPNDSINCFLDIGMNCEEIINSQGPNKSQKSITCSLERFKTHIFNHCGFDSEATDVEGLIVSEDDETILTSVINNVPLDCTDGNGYVCVTDAIVSSTFASPSVTPEPKFGSQSKKKTLVNQLNVNADPVISLTDIEMLSDTDSNMNQYRKFTSRNKAISMWDTSASDSEESNSPPIHYKQQKSSKRMVFSKSFDSIKSTRSSKLKATLNIGTQPKNVEAITDTEIIEDGKPYICNKKGCTSARPSVIHKNKAYTSNINEINTTTKQKCSYFPKKHEMNPKEPHFSKPGASQSLHIQKPNFIDYTTDIEAFESDGENVTNDFKTVAYIPDTKCELVITNENHKGGVSLIMPLTDLAAYKRLDPEFFDCGYSDVEELPDFEIEEHMRYPTPDIPRTESSEIKNSECLLDNSNLQLTIESQEPLTDTEEINFAKEVKYNPNYGNQLFTVQKVNQSVQDCVTDIEELVESDQESKEEKVNIIYNQLPTTDIDDLTADENEDEINQCTLETPELRTSNTYITSKEGIRPFSNEIKKQLYNSIPRIQMISPSPIPHNTDIEDIPISQEEFEESNSSSDAEKLEDHVSVIHIKHTRKFQTEGDESAHIKGSYNVPEPVTDVEEIGITENVYNRRKICHKKKDFDDNSIKICFTGSKSGISCKWHSKNVKTQGYSGDRQTISEPTKEAVDNKKILKYQGFSKDAVELASSWPKLSCRRSNDNFNRVFYTELHDDTVYPPHLGYSEFQSEAMTHQNQELTLSTLSLTFDTGTESFSELLFSSSNSECDSPYDSLSTIKEIETNNILPMLNEHIEKVPLMSDKKNLNESEDDSEPSIPSRQLEMRLKSYLQTSSQSLSKQEQLILEPIENLELKKLEDTIDNMLTDIKKEEDKFYSNLTHIKDEENSNYYGQKSIIPEKLNISDDAIGSLSEIENHISKLLSEVDEQSRNNFKFKEGAIGSTLNKNNMSGIQDWNMLSARVDKDSSIGDFDNLKFRESSCTPSPIDSCSTSEDEFEVNAPKVQLEVGQRCGRSTINISINRSPAVNIKRKNMFTQKKLNRSLPSLNAPSLSLPLREHNSVESILSFDCMLTDYRTSSVEYIVPQPGMELENSGYCIWSMPDEQEVDQYGDEKEDISMVQVIENKSPLQDEKYNVEVPQKFDNINIGIDDVPATIEEMLTSNEKEELLLNDKQIPSVDDYMKEIDPEKPSDEEDRKLNPTRDTSESEINIIEEGEINYESSDGEISEYKPYITTPTQSRRCTGIGGSQRLPRGERPTVRVVTDFLEDSNDSDLDEDNYTVTEPFEMPPEKKRNVKIRFSPDLYDDEEKFRPVEVVETVITSVETDAGKKIERVERHFERMASKTKEADPSESAKTDGEFQRIVSQLSLEEVDQALHLWDAGGLTPSDIDSKDMTLSSEELSPLQQESSHTLEPEEPCEIPPIPSPRAAVKPKDISPLPQSFTTKEIEPIEDIQNYASKKMFWEQMSGGSTELAPEQEAPIPKPRTSLTSTVILSEMKKEIESSYSDASRKLEASDIETEKLNFQGTTTTEKVVSGFTMEHSMSQEGDTNSEVEYIKTHELEELSYDNDAFKLDDTDDVKHTVTRPRKPLYERSVSLPCDSTIEASNVRTKKRIFEAQIKKEMVVEQLMAQLEEESSPEHKSLEQKTKMPAKNAQAMVSRQIHSDIFSDELEERIEFHEPENKELVQEKVITTYTQEEIEAELYSNEQTEIGLSNVASSQSSFESNYSKNVAEVLQYKNGTISKPSDSLEVHVDKSELEDTEKEKDIDEDLRNMVEIEEAGFNMPSAMDQTKVSSITSSQGESEDTFSESDVTPEDARFKEQHDLQDWALPDKDGKLSIDSEETKKQRNVYTPEEHIPDTVWEVPVQEEIETIEEEIVQFPSIPKDENVMITKTEEMVLSETEAREIAENVVEEIETKLAKCKEVAKTYTKNISEESQEISVETKKSFEISDLSRKSEQMLKFVRTDTTTSSMEITDEDLRSSGVETDNSPLESQAGRLYPLEDHSGDSSDDVEIQELDQEPFGKEVVDKTLAEVKQSLNAVKEELIEEKKKKKDSITKESPSEFEFKVVSLENTFSESIQECHHEEISLTSTNKQKLDKKMSEGKEDTILADIITAKDSSIIDEIMLIKEKSVQSSTTNLQFKESIKTETSQTITQSSDIDLKEVSKEIMSESNVIISDLEKTILTQKELAKGEELTHFTQEKLSVSQIIETDTIEKHPKSIDIQLDKGKFPPTVQDKNISLEDDRQMIEKPLTTQKTDSMGEEIQWDDQKNKLLFSQKHLELAQPPADSASNEDEIPKSSYDKTTEKSPVCIDLQKVDELSIKSQDTVSSQSEFELKTQTILTEKREAINNEVSLETQDILVPKDISDKHVEIVQQSILLPGFGVDKHHTLSVIQQESQSSSGIGTETHNLQDNKIKLIDLNDKVEIIEENKQDLKDIIRDVDPSLTKQDDRKSPLQEDAGSTSSSSEQKLGSESIGIDKPNVIIRKHKKTHLTMKHSEHKSDGELYSSSGESHYQSFEQTSESIKTPGSRPLSSDIEGLAPNLGGITGSSEYESAVSHEISGHSTTATSREFHTAVSSLSSRDSMKSLDSESSGNLASVEVSSEASETLVPSAMELEKDMETEISTTKYEKPIHFKIDDQVKMQSFSESIEQSVSFDISAEEISEDEVEVQVGDSETSQRMKRSHEMTFQPEPRPIVIELDSAKSQDEKYCSSLDDVNSVVSTSEAVHTVVELSRTESEKMEGSATSEQLSLTVSGTYDAFSLSESKDLNDTETVVGKVESISTQSPPMEHSGILESVTITTSSVTEHGIQSVCTQVTSKTSSKVTSQSNGPTQVEYNAEYDEGEPEFKKKGHRRNGSTSFRPSMIPVLYNKDSEKKKTDDIAEDTAESDKYTESLTLKEGSQEEKKDVDEAERLEEEFYQTEADQGLHRDIREGRVILEDTFGFEDMKDYDFDSSILANKSRLPSAAFSDDHPDSELAELLKQCSTDLAGEDPIERPRTPEPIEECELKDDTPEFSSEAQASVTELEMEYSGAFSRACEYEAHISPIREKGDMPYESWEQLSEDHEQELAEAEAAFYSEHAKADTPLPKSSLIHPIIEKHELETQELIIKEEPIDALKIRASPVPDITVTQHMTPTFRDSFDGSDVPDTPQPSSAMPDLNKTTTSEKSTTFSFTEKKTTVEIMEPYSADNNSFVSRDDSKDHDSTTDSPTSDSFELLEKPDIADEFVIIEEVGKEAQEQDTEGKGVNIEQKRMSCRSQKHGDVEPLISPPTTTTKMTQLKYYSSGGNEEDILFDFDSGSPSNKAVSEEKVDDSSLEGSPPSALEQDFKPEVEASKKWIEMQFQGEPVAPIYGYDIDFERGPLEDIKEEDINDLESSSKIGSMGSQVSHSIGSFGSVKESLSSTPDYDVLAGRRFFTRSGDHDDVSMSSLQEFERLETLIALESTKHRSLGSQDSLTSSSNSRKHGSRSGGDDISLASLKEFEGLESACIAAERIERKAKAEEESLLSEIEEGHESQASESESCVTVSVGGINRAESDEDDYERRMFEIDEIIRQAQTNVEHFMGSQKKELIDSATKCESLGRADSLEEISKVPDLDLDQPVQSISYSSGKSYIQHWEELGEDLLTSTDSLEVKTQISKTSIADPFTTSTDSLEMKLTQDMMSVSTDSIELSQKNKKKDIMTDSIEVCERSSMINSTDSLEGKVTQANSIDEDEHHGASAYDQSSSSGKEGDLSSSGKDDSAEGAVGLTNRMPPPRAEFLLGSTDSLEPTSSTATHATYHYETDSVMSSSFTSGDSTTMVDDNDEENARASFWFEEGKPYVTEVIEPIVGDDDFPRIIHRTVEMPPEIHKISFKGEDAEKGLREYIEQFDPGEDMTETREVDKDGNVHIKRVIQKRIVIRPEELGGETTNLKGRDLEKYLKSLTDTQLGSGSPLLESVHISSPVDPHSSITTIQRTTTTTQIKGESLKTEQLQKEMESLRRGSRPQLKYDISVDEDPEYDPREHDWRFNLHTHLEGEEELHEVASGFTPSDGSSKPAADKPAKK